MMLKKAAVLASIWLAIIAGGFYLIPCPPLPLAQQIVPLIGAVPHPSGQTPTLVAHTYTYGTGSSCCTTSGVNTTGSTLLWVCYSGTTASYSAGSGTTGPISDSKSNTWNYLTQYVATNGNLALQCAYAYNPTVGASHTVTFDQTSSYYGRVLFMAWSGTNTTSSVYYGQQNGAVSTASVTSLATGNVTPTETNDLILTTLQSYSNASGMATTNSFSIVDSYGSYGVISDAYLLSISTSAIGTTWSITSSGVWLAAAIAIFKHG